MPATAKKTRPDVAKTSSRTTTRKRSMLAKAKRAKPSAASAAVRVAQAVPVCDDTETFVYSDPFPRNVTIAAEQWPEIIDMMDHPPKPTKALREGFAEYVAAVRSGRIRTTALG